MPCKTFIKENPCERKYAERDTGLGWPSGLDSDLIQDRRRKGAGSHPLL